MKKILRGLGLLLASASLAPAVHAQTNVTTGLAPQPAPSQSLRQPITVATDMTTGISGDWGGLRTKLYDQGFDFELGYVNELATNPRGGTSQGVTDISQELVGVAIDMGKIAGLTGGRGQITFFGRQGNDLDIKRQTGLLQEVQEAYGRGTIIRLAEVWYRQPFFNGAATLKVGRVPVNSDFAAFACDFQNLSFCAPAQGNLPISAGYWFDAPASNWGAVGKLNFGKDRKHGYFQVGVFQVNPKNIDPHNGFRLAFSGGTGVLVPIEAAWTPMVGGDKPGYYKIGGWYETSRTNDIARDANGQLIAASGLPGQTLRGRYGGYIQIEQQLTPSPAGLDRRGLSVFFNATQFDRRTTIVDSQIAAGFTQTGTFSGRPNDQIAFAVARTHVNGRLNLPDKIAVADGLMPGVRHSEYLLELDYRFVPIVGIKVAPNVQWGIDPGGVAERQNVIALGIKTSLTF